MSSKSSKMKVLVMCNGFEMRKSRTTKTVQSWRCLKKTCSGTAISALQATVGLKQKNSHNCRKSLSNFAKRQKIEQLKADAVKTIGITSGKVVELAKNNVPDDQLLALQSDRALQGIVLRQRRQIGAERVDRPLKNIKWLPCFQETKQGHNFLIYDSRNTEPNNSVMFIFLSESKWSVDGTFFSVLKLFHQLYSKLEEYLLYFEKTYVRRVKAGMTKEGSYPVKIWNQRDAALKGLPRTNNHIEGWHRSFNDRFPRANMPLMYARFILLLIGRWWYVLPC